MRGLGDPLSIGERIAFYRKRRGCTQEVLGRSTDWLAKIETGRRRPPRIDMVTELSRILRLPLGDLLGQQPLKAVAGVTTSSWGWSHDHQPHDSSRDEARQLPLALSNVDLDHLPHFQVDLASRVATCCMQATAIAPREAIS